MLHFFKMETEICSKASYFLFLSLIMKNLKKNKKKIIFYKNPKTMSGRAIKYPIRPFWLGMFLLRYFMP